MRRRILAIYLLLAFLVGATGCATSPESQWLQARHALTGLQDVAVIAHESAVITDEDFLGYIVPAALAARDTLEKAKAHLPEGGAEFDIAMQYVAALLARIERAAYAGVYDE